MILDCKSVIQNLTYRLLYYKVFPIGNLSGDSLTGSWNDLDFNLLMLQAVVYTSSAPHYEDGSCLELTPVDWVAKFIVNCVSPVRVQAALGNTYHLINHNPLPLGLSKLTN